ncbi:MAG: ISAs1 family transposase, partial [Treponemataceae bacterium]
EWSVETMHWLLDVHFYEDMCRVHDATIQQVCNMGRKIALNLIKTYKQKTNSKSSLKSIMLKALINPSFILKILQT